jgi:glycogen operon protein
VLRNEEHLTGEDRVGSGYPDISWHGLEAWEPDWSSHVRTLAFMLCGRHVSGADGADDYVYVAMNMHWEGYTFELPLLPRGMTWRRFVDTAAAYPNDIQPVGEEPRLPNQRRLPVGPRSVVILVGR